ncbi:MAG TPA: glycoside hydrolase family 3 N-terminal domain-containing protein [Thermoanaerobaculia bacterium]|nr:glycoside hydrolase family 3 N-terminal domain-containing protein [Thermoanaerobaculia bacterium]
MTSQLFAIGLEGPELAPAERGVLQRLPPRGVILFRRNLATLDGLARLVSELREIGVSHLYLDQEGGPVDRLRELVAPSPSLARAARTGTARRAGEAAGAMLAALGFDVDLAPVVDRGLPEAGALVLGERCAAADPAAIVRAAGDFLDGLHSHGVGGCLKHFPGLGRARLDTHQALPALPDDPAEEELDLEPFRRLMERARAVMISHAAATDGRPASLSPAVATGLLRERLRFRGASFSDDLEMGALSEFGGLPERCVLAAAAGCDLLLVCRRIADYPACVEAVQRSVPAARRQEAASRLDAYDRHLQELRQSSRAPALTLAEVRTELTDLA